VSAQPGQDGGHGTSRARRDDQPCSGLGVGSATPSPPPPARGLSVGSVALPNHPCAKATGARALISSSGVMARPSAQARVSSPRTDRVEATVWSNRNVRADPGLKGVIRSGKSDALCWRLVGRSSGVPRSHGRARPPTLLTRKWQEVDDPDVAGSAVEDQRAPRCARRRIGSGKESRTAECLEGP
jgi:hypothetical protein